MSTNWKTGKVNTFLLWLNTERLLREVAELPSLVMFKTQLDTALGNLLQQTLLEQEDWTRQFSEISSNINYSVENKTPLLNEVSSCPEVILFWIVIFCTYLYPVPLYTFNWEKKNKIKKSPENPQNLLNLNWHQIGSIICQLHVFQKLLQINICQLNPETSTSILLPDPACWNVVGP